MKSMSFLHEKGFYVLSEEENVKSLVSLRIKKEIIFKQFYTKHYLNARDGRRLHS